MPEKPTIECFKSGLEHPLWEVHRSAVRLGCTNDYTERQLKAWVPDEYKPDLWGNRIRGINPFVAFKGGVAVGYADVQSNGYIDHFFVHGKHQNEGVGSALMAKIFEESKNLDLLFSHVSVTAKSFFEKSGFVVIREQRVDIKGVELANYLMEYRK